jgi:hypothetical protein
MLLENITPPTIPITIPTIRPKTFFIPTIKRHIPIFVPYKMTKIVKSSSTPLITA